MCSHLQRKSYSFLPSRVPVLICPICMTSESICGEPDCTDLLRGNTWRFLLSLYSWWTDSSNLMLTLSSWILFFFILYQSTTFRRVAHETFWWDNKAQVCHFYEMQGNKEVCPWSLSKDFLFQVSWQYKIIYKKKQKEQNLPWHVSQWQEPKDFGFFSPATSWQVNLIPACLFGSHVLNRDPSRQGWTIHVWDWKTTILTYSLKIWAADVSRLTNIEKSSCYFVMLLYLALNYKYVLYRNIYFWC